MNSLPELILFGNSNCRSSYDAVKTKIVENKYLDKKDNVSILFERFADRYLEEYAKQREARGSKNSWEKSDGVQITILKRYFSGKYLDEITVADINKFKIDRRKIVKPSTVNRGLACLSSIYNRAIEWDCFFGENPIKRVKFYEEPPARTRFLKEKEIFKLLECCEEGLKPLFVLAINTGMRKGNLLNLKWDDDVDFDEKTLCLGVTKNGQKIFIPMNSDVFNTLKGITRQADSPYVFCKKVEKNGEVEYSPVVNIKGAFKRAKVKAKIEDYTWHDNRTTCASWLAMRKTPLPIIAKILGHKSLRMTEKYAHFLDEYKKEAVDTLEGLTGSV